MMDAAEYDRPKSVTAWVSDNTSPVERASGRLRGAPEKPYSEAPIYETRRHTETFGQCS
jgi:hypothetical protein